jgi:Tfp pilus assembly protein PilF
MASWQLDWFGVGYMARRGLNSKKNGIAGVLLGLSLALTSAYAQGGRVTQIEVDSQQNLVFAVQGLEAPPTQPKFMPLENPAQLLIELSGLDLDRQNLPSAEELSEKLSQSIPGMKSIKYLMAVGPDGKPTNTCRFLLEFVEGSEHKPTLARLNENLVAVHFGGAVTASVPAANSQPAARCATASAPANPGDMQSAYEQYYRAFMAQKSQSKSLSSDWQQRTGSISELGTNKNLKPVVTDTALDIPAAAAKAVLPEEEKIAVGTDTRKEEPGWDWSQEKSGDTSKLDIKPIPINSPQPTVAAAPEAPVTPQQVAQVVPASPVVQQPVPEAQATSSAVNQDTVQAPEQAAQAGSTTDVPASATGEDAVAANPLDAILAGADSPKLKARKLFNQAVDDHLHGRLDQAIVGYKAAISVNPELATAHSNLGLAYNQKNNYASAIGEFHKALALNPKDAITYNGIGAALKAEKDLSGAVANLETAVKYDPKLAVAHYNLGTVYEALGELDKAINSYESALRADSHMGEAHYRVGLILQKRKRFAEAKERFQSAIKIDASSGYSADARQRLSLLGGAKSIR